MNDPIRRVGRIAAYLASGVVALAAVGAASQVLLDAINGRRHRPPGDLVAVNGHRLHLECRGHGTPTVLLESGGGGFGLMWEWVSRELAPATTVCTYDRAGLGWSEPGSPPRDAEQVIADLGSLIDAAGIERPLILVGLSVGGTFALGYAQRHPDRVAGLVLVDARHPATLETAADPASVRAALDSWVRLGRGLAYIGALRVVIPLTGQLDGLPPDVAPATMARTASTRLWRTYADEAAVIEETEAQVDSRAGHLGSLPLLVVTAGALEGVDPLEAAEHLERQVDLVTMSTNGRHVVMEHASHLNIILEEQHARELAGHIQDLMAELRDSSVRSPR